ncbi:hypothetical protein [Candidatus Uabimicrobium amorphum]|uniref:Uncharacterized protein n=1 Tax=Uabimicrobium amorphum TaxID=2596890 RepID=A0A5S9IN24_UABAM|nr:hypothetical protein [Candidatus Uabimicrobium amorphum]BBM84557.1 hypothetical protein UABAM_02918 [Candidatus Uabimicrobium amorphum]
MKYIFLFFILSTTVFSDSGEDFIRFKMKLKSFTTKKTNADDDKVLGLFYSYKNAHDPYFIVYRSKERDGKTIKQSCRITSYLTNKVGDTEKVDEIICEENLTFGDEVRVVIHAYDADGSQDVSPGTLTGDDAKKYATEKSAAKPLILYTIAATSAHAINYFSNTEITKIANDLLYNLVIKYMEDNALEVTAETIKLALTKVISGTTITVAISAITVVAGAYTYNISDDDYLGSTEIIINANYNFKRLQRLQKTNANTFKFTEEKRKIIKNNLSEIEIEIEEETSFFIEK